MDPIPDDLLGRYENITGSSNKYWACQALENGGYKVTWGPRGTPETASRLQVVDRATALARIREKLRSGYEHTQDHRGALVALERLALNALFEKGSTALKRRPRNAQAPVDAPVAPAEPSRALRRRL